MTEHPRRAEFMAWLERVAEEAWQWEDAFPSYDRDPDGGHQMGAWAANIGDSLWRAEQALTGQSQDSPYIYLCKCLPVGTSRIGKEPEGQAQ